MKIAIVHDWLVTYAGAERVLEQMLLVYPQSDIYSIVDFLPENNRQFILNKPVNTSFIQKLPFARTKYRTYLPLMMLAIEQFDLSAYDLIISSSHAVAKGVITGPDQLHVCMCYSPARYAWDLQFQYLTESGLNRGIKGWLAKWQLHKLRIWDIRASFGVDDYIAISEYIARRISKVYRRESTIIYPPVDVSSFKHEANKSDFYLTASRMVPYKKMDLIVKAFIGMPDKKLKIIGSGPDLDKIKSAASGCANIEVLGYQPFEVLMKSMQQAKAFIFAAEEDFGITPLEAQACGTPVIAYGKGGVLETIKGVFPDIEESYKPGFEEYTGVFFDQQTAEDIKKSVIYFEQHQKSAFSSNRCRENAERFSNERFCSEFKEHIENKREAIPHSS